MEIRGVEVGKVMIVGGEDLVLVLRVPKQGFCQGRVLCCLRIVPASVEDVVANVPEGPADVLPQEAKDRRGGAVGVGDSECFGCVSPLLDDEPSEKHI